VVGTCVGLATRSAQQPAAWLGEILVDPDSPTAITGLQHTTPARKLTIRASWRVLRTLAELLVCGIPFSAMTDLLSAREAADYCGVSEKTVRNWILSGRLIAEKSAGSFRIDRERLEPLRRKSAGSPQGADRQPEGSAPEGSAPEGFAPEGRGPSARVITTDDMLQFVREAHAEAIAKAEAAAMWQARAEFLAGELAQAREQLKMLEAPKVEEQPEHRPRRLRWKGWRAR
jgi:excisionase family DNA binding protein